MYGLKYVGSKNIWAEIYKLKKLDGLKLCGLKKWAKKQNKIMGQAISVKTSLWSMKRLLAMWALAGQNSFCDILFP